MVATRSGFDTTYSMIHKLSNSPQGLNSGCEVHYTRGGIELVTRDESRGKSTQPLLNTGFTILLEILIPSQRPYPNLQLHTPLLQTPNSKMPHLPIEVTPEVNAACQCTRFQVSMLSWMFWNRCTIFITMHLF